MPTVNRIIANGVELAVNAWGLRQNPPVLLLHGWGDSGATFDDVAQQLATEFFVVAPDLRGFGDSARVPGYWFPDYLADVDVVANTLFGAVPFVLVGHSMGGNIAALYAGIRAERVSHLGLLEGFGLPPTEPSQAPARYRRWLDEASNLPGLRDFPTFETLCAHLLRLAPRATAEVIAAIARCWANPLDDGRWRLKMDPAHKRSNPVLYRREEAAACWRATTAPVLLVTARQSDFIARFPRFDVLADTAGYYACARQAWIEEAGHMLHWEQPRAVADVIRDFIHSAP